MPLKDEIVSRIRSVPPLSHTARQIMAILCDRGHAVEKLARIIETDAALTARVLSIVHAAALFCTEPITTIAGAMSVIGEKVMLGIALDYCTGCDSLCYQLESGYKELLGIRKDQLPAIMLRVDEEFQRMRAFVNGGACYAENIDR
jgi:hypothetical protein